MKKFIIKSDVSSSPLAEIRTDGKKIEFLVDNTNGKLPKATNLSMERLKQLIQNSSHMTMEPSKENTEAVLRYIMTNGDIVEVTTDGKTALLNDELLDEDERKALFEAIRSGDLSVSHKADLTKPIPVIPAQSSGGPVVQVGAEEDNKFDPVKINELKDYEDRQRKEREQGDKYFDENIEKSADDMPEHEQGFFKHLLYNLKYGRG